MGGAVRGSGVQLGGALGGSAGTEGLGEMSRRIMAGGGAVPGGLGGLLGGGSGGGSGGILGGLAGGMFGDTPGLNGGDMFF